MVAAEGLAHPLLRNRQYISRQARRAGEQSPLPASVTDRICARTASSDELTMSATIVADAVVGVMADEVEAPGH